MSVSLLQQVRIGETDFDVGSDFHWPTQGQLAIPPDEASHRLAKRLETNQRSRYLILAGDIMHGSNVIGQQRGGLDVSRHINEFLTIVRRKYERVLYVAGNHCLRRATRTMDPWESLDPGENVEMPRGNAPVITSINGTRILLANMFYDGNFCGKGRYDPMEHRYMLGFRVDGHALLMGTESIPYFREMTAHAADALTPDIDAVVSHVPQHPLAARTLIGQDGPRAWHNLLGSNIFDPDLRAQPRDGVTAIFGHTHQSEEHTTNIEGRNVRFISHQPQQYC